jgi:hypothetical protein
MQLIDTGKNKTQKHGQNDHAFLRLKYSLKVPMSKLGFCQLSGLNFLKINLTKSEGNSENFCFFVSESDTLPT